MTASDVLIGRSLTIDDVVQVARHGARVRLDDAARPRILSSRVYVDALVAADRTVYGITTGFGRLASVRIAAGDVQQLQRNLLVSHAMGVGVPFPTEVVRAMLLLRAQSLSFGYSGIRISVIELLLTCLNRGVHPVIPCQGSVGASGDLAPLAHMALPLIGEGKAEVGGEVMHGRDALAHVGLAPIVLEAKEGLALINGTQAMTAIGALVLHDAQRLATLADVAGAMSLEALKGTSVAFDVRVAEVRAHPGAVDVAANLRRLSADSPIHGSHAACDKLQDAYSLRCMPQVHGASRDALTHAVDVVTRECNAVTDYPLVFADTDDVISAGNFH